MTDSRPSPAFPAAAVRLAALWILAGAVFKLGFGTPMDLPKIVREASALPIGTTYRLVIAIELVVVALAFLRPRWGWWVVVFQYLVFEAVLATQIQSGAKACGCFGSKLEALTPTIMMTIDTALLLLLLASRPWRITKRGLALPLLVPLCALLAALPWLFDREVRTTPQDPSTPGGTTSTSPNRGFAVFDIENWVGKTIAETPLGEWLEEDVSTLPTEGMWVLWRWTCDHCAKHLEELVREPPFVPFLTLVRVHERHDSPENKLVHFIPEGEGVVHANLPDTIEYAILTPAELMLEGGIIVSAKEGL